MASDQLHGVTETLHQAARMAGTVSESIDGHRAALRPTVDTLMASEWRGSAAEAFARAHEKWETGMVSLCGSLRTLGENTAFSMNTYAEANEAGQTQLSKVESMGAFGGALRG